jgi:hypothetical protein
MAADRNQRRAICGSKKRRVLQKRHRPPPDKTSGHNFETAMYHHEYKNLHGKPRWAGKMSRKREKKNTNSQTSRLENQTWRSFSYTKITKNSCFDCAVALCTIQNALLVISNLTWLDFEILSSNQSDGTYNLLSITHLQGWLTRFQDFFFWSVTIISRCRRTVNMKLFL